MCGSLSPILLSVYIKKLLKEVEEAGLGVQLCTSKSIREECCLQMILWRSLIRGRNYRS